MGTRQDGAAPSHMRRIVQLGIHGLWLGLHAAGVERVTEHTEFGHGDSHSTTQHRVLGLLALMFPVKDEDVTVRLLGAGAGDGGCTRLGMGR